MKILEKLRKAFKTRNLNALKRISNQAIERAAMTEDSEMVNVSLIAYALYKLLSKQHVLESEQWERFVGDVDKDLGEAIVLHEKGEAIGGLLERDVIRDIAQIDDSLGNYVQDVMEKARVKQASRIYAMGLSVDKAVALTGANKFQLLSYIGGTTIHDRHIERAKSVADRYRTVKEVLEGKQ